MNSAPQVFQEIPGLYRILPLRVLRKTPGVSFDFHRIRSDEESGSASINFAVRYEGFDVRTNFNVYDLDPVGGKYRMIRAGYLDQPT
jgi:hypothetical protein